MSFQNRSTFAFYAASKNCSVEMVEDAFRSDWLWQAARKQLASISELADDWDGHGTATISNEIIRSTYVALQAARSQGCSPPCDVYPTPDGTIIVEWQFADDIIARIDVECWGEGTEMVSYPDKPSHFRTVKWCPSDRLLAKLYSSPRLNDKQGSWGMGWRNDEHRYPLAS